MTDSPHVRMLFHRTPLNILIFQRSIDARVGRPLASVSREVGVTRAMTTRDHTHVASNVVVVVVVVAVVVVAVVDTCVRGRRRNTRACLKMSERHSIHRS